MVEFVNGGFEAGPNLSSDWVLINTAPLAATWIPGWTLVSGSVDLQRVNITGDPADRRSVDLNGAGAGTIAQTLDTSAHVGQTVRFSIDVRSNTTPGVTSGFTLRINGQPVLPEDASAAASANPSTGLVILVQNSGTTTFTSSFTATGSDTVSITGYSTNPYRGTALGGIDVIAIVCLARGTRIATETGEVAVEHLSEGDRVLTADRGFQPLRWIGRRSVPADALRADPKLRPIRIAAGALGQGLPRRDLWVSRQHRMLIRSPIVTRLCGVPEVLVPAIRLTDLPGIARDESCAAVDYFHLAFDRHEVILAEGAPTESLLLGPRACEILGPATLQALGTACADPARPIPEGRRVRQLIARHAANGKPVLTPAAAGRPRAC